MKKVLFLLLAALITNVLQAQSPAISTKYSDAEIAELILRYKNSRDHDTHATGVLLQRFRQDFPNARDVEWETNGELYEVEFEIGPHDFAAFYDRNGELLMYKQKIRVGELPAIVKTAAEARFPKYRFDDIEKIVKGTQTFYEIEMKLREAEVKMIITDRGEVIREKYD